MGNFHEGSQGQTERFILLKKILVLKYSQDTNHPDVGFCDIPQSFQADTGIVP